jgi:hypothetical protein
VSHHDAAPRDAIDDRVLAFEVAKLGREQAACLAAVGEPG